MKKLVLIMLFGLTVPVLAGKTQPAYEPEIFIEGNHSSEKIAQVIKSALSGRTWAVKGEEKGVIKSQIWVRSHSAKIRITYTKKSIKIHFEASENLNESRKGDTVFIHRNYNRWITNLENDIKAGLFSL